MYENGFYVEHDPKKSMHHYDQATILVLGHETARFNVGVHEYSRGDIIQSMKRLMLAISNGDQ